MNPLRYINWGRIKMGGEMRTRCVNSMTNWEAGLIFDIFFLILFLVCPVLRPRRSKTNYLASSP